MKEPSFSAYDATFQKLPNSVISMNGAYTLATVLPSTLCFNSATLLQIQREPRGTRDNWLIINYIQQFISLQEHCAVSNILWTFWRMLFHHGTYPLILCTCSPWSMCWNFMAFLYLNLLYLPDPQPRVLVVTCRRSYESVQEVGKNIAIVWRPDSSVLAVTVSFSALVYTLYTVL